MSEKPAKTSQKKLPESKKSFGEGKQKKVPKQKSPEAQGKFLAVEEKEIIPKSSMTTGMAAEGLAAKKKTRMPIPKKEQEELSPKVRYWEAVGRRKTSVARVRLFTKGDKEIMVNERSYLQYFPTKELQLTLSDPLVRMKNIDKFRVSVKVFGGGMRGQAEAIRHGISRALVRFNPDFKKRLQRAGFLTRDSRMKERKKFGFKSARRAPQWQKR